MAKNSNETNAARLLTVREAEDRLSVSRSKIYAMAREGRLELVKLGARSTRLRESDIAKLVAGAE